MGREGEGHALTAEDMVFVSAKTGEGIDDLPRVIVEKIPAPRGDSAQPLRALIYDAKADVHRGVECHLRVMDGVIRKADKIQLMAASSVYHVSDIGVFTPKMTSRSELTAGEVGYLFAGIKTVHDVHIGDTVTLTARPCESALPGYQPPQRMVFCDFYPGPGTTSPELRESMEELWLNDSSFNFSPVSSTALGSGFRCGFLGLLHMKIIQERLERESNIDVLQTAPTVGFEIVLRGGKTKIIESPADLPGMDHIEEIREPFADVQMIVPAEHVGAVMQLSMERRGKQKRTEYLSPTRAMLTFNLPLADVIYDMHDRLKSVTRGYGTMDYELVGYHPADLVRLDIMVGGKRVDALSIICDRRDAERRGRAVVKKLRKEIDRHMFEIALQAAIGSRIIARETIAPMRKNVTAKCYGGDISRKRKLWAKQKEGKKRMKSIGSVDIPQKAFLAVLDTGAEKSK